MSRQFTFGHNLPLANVRWATYLSGQENDGVR